jgi:Holliday junction resolvase RusA-like endonuclease
MSNLYVFDIAPVSKPRMVRSDKWKKRPATDSYWAFKDELKLKANLAGLHTLPSEINYISFIVPMPASWSEKKKKQYDGMPHEQRPDLDNFLKGLQDCLCSEDSHIWKISNLLKIWGREGKLIIDC